MNLQVPVTKIANIGPIYQKRLAKLDIHTLGDLLYHFPSRYQDYSNIKTTFEAQMGEILTIVGVITEIKNIYTKRRKKITEALVSDQYGSVKVIWFNQHFLTRTLKIGMSVSLSGKIDVDNYQKTLISPEYEILKPNPKSYKAKEAKSYEYAATIHTGRLVPIYPETTRLSSKWLRSRIKPLLPGLQLIEYLPPQIIAKERFPEINTALKKIHFPDTLEEAQLMKCRFAFEELFLLQLSNLIKKEEWQSHERKSSWAIDQTKVLNFIHRLPFSLTRAQEITTREILTDLSSRKPMNRLLEGDVGSGKTVVACIAAYVAFLNGYQAAFMAPTEVLAHQHFQTVSQLLKPYGIEVNLITGSKKLKAGEAEGEKLKAIFIGTHALLYNRKLLPNLGLLIIDEQHRFGVEQRALLAKETGYEVPHVLTMTATPIPRSLALAFYGDLDLSIIDEMPRGRKRVKTFVTPNEKREKAYQWIEDKIVASFYREQAFIIYPLIEESEAETMKNIRAATTEFERLQPYFPRLKIGLLHGRLKTKEKESVVNDFKNKKIHILVSTSVVEVGIDIPSASIIIIEHSERFGLAQLHQLRGRVGRSDIESYCFLFTNQPSPQIIRRLKSLEEEHSGLKLAEIDLKLRGPGEVFGTKQHGLPELKVASFTDFTLIAKSRQAAYEVWQEDKKLDRYGALRDKLKEITTKEVVPN